MEVWPHQVINFIFTQLGTDLSGNYRGLQIRDYPEWEILDSPIYKWGLFLVTLVGSILYYRNRRPVLSSVVLFIVVSLTAYSVSGRHFMYEAMGLILVSTLVANLWGWKKAVEEKNLLALRFAFATVTAVYLSSFWAKMAAPGGSWVNAQTIPLFLQFHHYQIETESVVWMPVFNFLESFFNKPNALSSLLPGLIVAVEGISPLFILSRWTREKLAPVLWITLQFGFLVVVGVLSKPILISIVILALPEAKPKADGLLLKAILFIWVISCVGVGRWAPADKYRGTSVVYPFSRFSMFADFKVNNIKPSIDLLMFRPLKDESSYQSKDLLSPVGHGPYHLSKKFAFDYPGQPLGEVGFEICAYVVQRWMKKVGSSPGDFEVWTRTFFLENDLVKIRDSKIYGCEGQL